MKDKARRLLLELKNVPLLGQVPSTDAYYAHLLTTNDVYYEPVSGATDSAFAAFEKFSKNWVADIENEPLFIKHRDSLVGAGLWKIETVQTGEYSYPNEWRSIPKLERPTTAERVKPLVPTGSGLDNFLVDKSKQIIDMDVSRIEWRTRRGPKLVNWQRSGKSFVIPSGDVSFKESILPIQKLLKHVMKHDPGVLPTFKIVNSEKFRNKTIADILGLPREVENALTGNSPIIMYHGTSVKKWKKIKKVGLQPGHFNNTYVDLVPNYSDQNVYLTFSHSVAENYATRQSVDDGGDAIVLKVIVPDPTKLRTDEDNAESITLSKEYTKRVFDPETDRTSSITFSRISLRLLFAILSDKKYQSSLPTTAYDVVLPKEFEELKRDALNSLQSQTKNSLKRGTIAYHGWIPPKFISPSLQYKRQTFQTPEKKGGPGQAEYNSIRRDVLANAKRTDESILRGYIKTILLEKRAAPEASADDIYGEYLFGAPTDSRSTDTVLRIFRDDVDPPEPNTYAEYRLMQALKNWFKGDRESVDAEMISLLNQLRQQGKYSTVLEPPSGYAYRLLSIKADKWKPLQSGDALNRLGKGEFVAVEGGQLKQKRGQLVSSWTIDKKMFVNSLRRFRSLLLRGHDTFVICAADVDANRNNFLFNPKYTRKLAGSYDWQEEILQTGPINVSASYFGSIYDQAGFTVHEEKDVLRNLEDMLP